MARIRCHYSDCVHLESKFCSADSVELDPEMGCLSYTQEGGAARAEGESWDEDFLEDEEEEWEDLEEFDEEFEDEEEEEW